MPTYNDTRAARAESVLRQYIEAKGDVLEKSSSEIADLIADLLHLTARLDERDDPVERALRLAKMHFDAEHGNPEEEEEEEAESGSQHYTVGSSHGELTIDAGGHVIARRLSNNDTDGGRHLKSITRFDLEEWHKYWDDPELRNIDILGIGYWYTDPETGKTAFAPPDEKWRAEIAQILLERRTAAGKGGAACRIYVRR